MGLRFKLIMHVECNVLLRARIRRLRSCSIQPPTRSKLHGCRLCARNIVSVVPSSRRDRRVLCNNYSRFKEQGRRLEMMPIALQIGALTTGLVSLVGGIIGIVSTFRRTSSVSDYSREEHTKGGTDEEQHIATDEPAATDDIQGAVTETEFVD